MSRFSRIILYFFLALAVIFVGLIIFFQTGFFRSWLEEKVITSANEALNGKITSLKLSGNYLSNLNLEDIVIEVDDEPFLKAKRLSLRYKLSPFALMANVVTVDHIYLEAPEVFLAQDENHVWNFDKLVKDSLANDVEPAATEEAPLAWQINLPEIELVSGNINVEPGVAQNTGIPEKVKNINLKLGFWLDRENIRLALENLNFTTENPDFRMNTIFAEADYSSDKLIAKDIKIESDSTRISSNIELKNFDSPVIDFFAEGKPISLTELGRAFPELNLRGNPRIEIAANGPLHDLNLKCLLWAEKGTLDLSGNCDFANEPYRYKVNGAVQRFDVSALIADSTLASDLNLTFDLNGRGIENGNIFARLVAKLDTSRFMNYKLPRTDLSCSVAGDTVNFNARAGLMGFRAELSGTVLQQSERFNARLQIQDLDLSQIDSTSGLKSDLNFQVTASGRNFDPTKTKADLDLTVFPSTLQNIPIDSGNVALDFSNEVGELRNFKITSPIVTLNASGNVSATQENALRFEADFTDFSLISQAFPVDSLAGNGVFTGSLRGEADSLLTDFKLAINNATFQDYALKQFIGTGDGVISAAGSRISVFGQLDEIKVGETAIDTSSFTVAYTDSFTTFRVDVKKPNEFDFATTGGFLLKGDSTIVEIDSLVFTGLQQEWHKTGDVTRIKLVGAQTWITPFDLVSEEQSISLQGLIDTEGYNDFEVKLSNLDFTKMKSMFPDQGDFEASFNFSLNLKEKFSAPELQGTVELNQGKYSAFTFEKFKGIYSYRDDLFTWDCFLAKDAVDSLLESSAKIPLHLSLSPFSQQLYLDRPFEFKISTRGLDLSFLQAFMTGVQDFQGKLVADIILSNTLNNLNGVGPIRLINASMKIPEFGLRYRKINLVIVLNKQELLIREFNMVSGDGTLQAVEGKLSLARDQVEQFSSKFRAKKFQLINNKTAQVRADGSLVLSGSVQNPVFTGDFTVDQARLFYETIEENTPVTLTSRPFFVISDDSVTFQKTGALRFQKTEDVQEYDFFESAFYRNLHGEFSVYFPRNTWIRSSDTSIEIEGDIIVVKDRGPNFVLFGSLSVMRGFYKLFGNRFQITKGEMIFNGDPELNPEISIEAQTTITSTPANEERPQKHEFKVLITETLLYPEFTFLLDDEVASQEDIAAIFLFGQRYADLGAGERSRVADNSGLDDRAKNLLTGQLLKQLSGTLGHRLSLDVIQIESGGGLADSKVKVGKYVTPDVFVSVSQDFGVEGNQIVELEYQIPRIFKFMNLLMQASSDRGGDTGLDLIWKIEW